MRPEVRSQKSEKGAACHKETFMSEQAALMEIAGRRRRRERWHPAKPPTPSRPYRCAACGEWHIVRMTT